MINDSEQSEMNAVFNKNRLVLLANIIEKLAGDKPNLKISLEEIRLNMGNTKVELNGEVNFNVVHVEV